MTTTDDNEIEAQLVDELKSGGADKVDVCWRTDTGDFEATVTFENGSSCLGHGSSRLDALHNAKGAMAVWMKANGGGSFAGNKGDAGNVTTEPEA